MDIAPVLVMISCLLTLLLIIGAEVLTEYLEARGKPVMHYLEELLLPLAAKLIWYLVERAFKARKLSQCVICKDGVNQNQEVCSYCRKGLQALTASKSKS